MRPGIEPSGIRRLSFLGRAVPLEIHRKTPDYEVADSPLMYLKSIHRSTTFGMRYL
jgi:hypothetical protein